jgi:Helix-turn-helix domain
MAKSGYAKILHALRKHLHEINGSQLKVWLCHRLHEDKNGTSFPSISLIAKETGLDPDTVKDAHKYLRDNGWLKTVSYRDSQSGKFAVPVAKCTYPWLTQDATSEDAKAPPGNPTVAGKTVPGSTVHGSTAPGPTVHGKPHPEVDTFEEAPIPSVASLPTVAIHPEVFRPSDEVRESVSKHSVASLPQENVATPSNKTINQEQPKDPKVLNREIKDGAFAEALVEPQVKASDLPYWSSRLGRLMDGEEWLVAEELYRDLIPMATSYPEPEILSLAEIALDMQQRYTPDTQHYDEMRGAGYNDQDNPIRSFWRWNQTHKKAQLVFFTMADLAKAWWSENPRGARFQWERHDPDNCPTCRKNPDALGPEVPVTEVRHTCSKCWNPSASGICSSCLQLSATAAQKPAPALPAPPPVAPSPPPKPVRSCEDCGAEFESSRGLVEYCPACKQKRSDDAYKRLVAAGKIPPPGSGKTKLAAFLDGEP